MKYPTAADVEEMKARGYDPSVIADQVELARRGEVLEELKVAVTQAFAGVTLGDGIGLLEAQGLDDYVDDKTLAAYREKDEREDWSALGRDDLARYNSSLSFFDAKGMRFHIPAFLLAAMDDDAFDLVVTLTYTADERFALLTPSQRKVIRDYLMFIEQEHAHASDRERIQTALSGYWAS